MSKRDNQSAMSISTLNYFYIFCVKSHLIYVLTMLMRFTEAKATIPKLQMLFLLRVQLKRNTSSKLPFGFKKILFFSWSVCRGIPESENITVYACVCGEDNLSYLSKKDPRMKKTRLVQ